MADKIVNISEICADAVCTNGIHSVTIGECREQTYFEIKNPDLNYGEFATFRKHKNKHRNKQPPMA